MKTLTLSLLILLALLTACATENTENPAAVVERYLQAKVAGDIDTLRELLCLPLESTLQREASSFASVTNASIEDMQCNLVEGSSIVQCTGEIVALYGTENTHFPLSSYQVVQEDGTWKWCGEGT